MRTRIELFDIINVLLLFVTCIVMLYPIWHVVVGSFMDGGEYLSRNILLYPERPTTENYTYLFRRTDLLQYVFNSLFITVVGTVVSVFLTTYTGYGLSRPFFGSTFLFLFCVVTMFIYPGLIPNYINLKGLGLINTRTVLIIFIMINPFFLVIVRSNFLVFPKELIESAKMDGAGENLIFFRIALPLSKAMVAAITVFIAVNYWNLYLPSVFYVSDAEKKTIQDYLASLLTKEQLAVDAAQAQNQPFTTVLMLASIVVGAFPIIAVYPFLQKHFVKGAMIGAIKG